MMLTWPNYFCMCKPVYEIGVLDCCNDYIYNIVGCGCMNYCGKPAKATHGRFENVPLEGFVASPEPALMGEQSEVCFSEHSSKRLS